MADNFPIYFDFTTNKSEAQPAKYSFYYEMKPTVDLWLRGFES